MTARRRTCRWGASAPRWCRRRRLLK